MNNSLRRVTFCALIILFSIAIPIIIISLFFIIFSDFYSKGFLTGAVQLFMITPLMILVNIVISMIYLNSHFNSSSKKGNIRRNNVKYFKMLCVSILIQIILNILVENPFKEPPKTSWF